MGITASQISPYSWTLTQAIQNSHWNARKSSIHLTLELITGEVGGVPSSKKNMYVYFGKDS